MQRSAAVIIFCLFAGVAPGAYAGGAMQQRVCQVSSDEYLSGSAPSQRFVVDLQSVAMIDSPAVVQESPKKSYDMTPRRVNALLLSIVVPGSGQTMLGDTYKGVGITLAYFGSALTVLISQNNFVARGERLDALEYQYATSTSWRSSNIIYGQMNDTYAQWKQDRSRRNVFLVVSAVIWIANIADLLYNTEDKGEKIFSQRTDGRTDFHVSARCSPVDNTTLFSFAIPLGR